MKTTCTDANLKGYLVSWTFESILEYLETYATVPTKISPVVALENTDSEKEKTIENTSTI